MTHSARPAVLFAALALFFFVFLEATLFYQTSMSMLTSSAKNSLSQFPIQGASALGLLAFSGLNRFASPNARPLAVGFLTAIGIVSLIGVASAPAPLALANAGVVAFFLIGLAGGAVYWAACVSLRRSKHFATLIGGSHALGIMAQVPFYTLTPNRFGEALLLCVGIVALGVLVARIWPDPSAGLFMPGARANSQQRRIRPQLPCGWRIDHLKPRAILALLVALVLMFATLFNTLYNLIEPGQAWTSQYSLVMPRVMLSIGGLGAGLLFDLCRAKYMGVTMFWISVLCVAAVFGLEAGMPERVGRVTFFLGSGAFITFYTAAFIWIAPYLRSPALWASMGRVISNLTAIAFGAPALLLIQSGNTLAVAAAMLPLLVGVNAVLFAIGMLDLRIPDTGERAEASGSTQDATRPEEPALRNRGAMKPGNTVAPKRNVTQPTASDQAALAPAQPTEPTQTTLEQPAAPSEQAAGCSPEQRIQRFATHYNLTPRECDVLAATIASEQPIKQIAADLGISMRVVQRHLTSIYEKTNTQSRIGLTKLFWE